ncbi:MAG TPA: STAS domain-containing protein, partial [Rhizomicrobium sp.]|nr:STAS domain-containing protein [Rhizomicrobium sp.]
SETSLRRFKLVSGPTSCKLVFLASPDGKSMKIDVHDAGATATMTLTGRLDLSGAEVVALPLATLSGSKNDLAVDMAGVTFISSMGLRHLVSAAKEMRRRGGRFVLLNPNAAVTEIIDAAGLIDYLKVERGDAAPR